MPQGKLPPFLWELSPKVVGHWVGVQGQTGSKGQVVSSHGGYLHHLRSCQGGQEDHGDPWDPRRDRRRGGYDYQDKEKGRERA